MWSGLDIGNSPALDIQQQLLLLLRRCLRRALELKLPQLVAFSRLALAKFDLKVRFLSGDSSPPCLEHTKFLVYISLHSMLTTFLPALSVTTCVSYTNPQGSLFYFQTSVNICE